MMFIWDGVHSGCFPFGIASIRDGVYSGWCSFGMVSIWNVSIPDRSHLVLSPFGNCPDTGISMGVAKFKDLIRLL